MAESHCWPSRNRGIPWNPEVNTLQGGYRSYRRWCILGSAELGALGNGWRLSFPPLNVWLWKICLKRQLTIPARDPTQCAVRFLKGKVERTQNHKWLQASRTRGTLVVKACCSFKVVSGRRDTSLDSVSSLCEDLCRRSGARSAWQVLCGSCCARPLGKAICTRCL